MLAYIVRRTLTMIPTLLVISFLTFLIIELPPGDFLTNQIAQLKMQGEESAIAKVEFLRTEFALDKPFFERYGIWLGAWPGPARLRRPPSGQLGLVLRIRPAGFRSCGLHVAADHPCSTP